MTDQTHSHVREIARIELGHGTNGYHWRVDSDCGVVKLHSSRDGCMVALNSHEAREVAWELYDGLIRAAASVDRASSGGLR